MFRRYVLFVRSASGDSMRTVQELVLTTRCDVAPKTDFRTRVALCILSYIQMGTISLEDREYNIIITALSFTLLYGLGFFVFIFFFFTRCLIVHRDICIYIYV